MRRTNLFQTDTTKNSIYHNNNKHNKNGQIDCVSNRLYKAAFLDRERKEKRIAASEVEAIKTYEALKWSLPDGSKRLMENFACTSRGDVGDRLHRQGQKDKAQRLKISDRAQIDMIKGVEEQNLELNQHVNSWSCSACGCFHTVTSVQRQSNTAEKVCKNCGWDGEETREAFRPLIITDHKPVKGKQASVY